MIPCDFCVTLICQSDSASSSAALQVTFESVTFTACPRTHRAFVSHDIITLLPHQSESSTDTESTAASGAAAAAAAPPTLSALASAWMPLLPEAEPAHPEAGLREIAGAGADVKAHTSITIAARKRPAASCPPPPESHPHAGFVRKCAFQYSKMFSENNFCHVNRVGSARTGRRRCRKRRARLKRRRRRRRTRPASVTSRRTPPSRLVTCRAPTSPFRQNLLNPPPAPPPPPLRRRGPPATDLSR